MPTPPRIHTRCLAPPPRRPPPWPLPLPLPARCGAAPWPPPPLRAVKEPAPAVGLFSSGAYELRAAPLPLGAVSLSGGVLGAPGWTLAAAPAEGVKMGARGGWEAPAAGEAPLPLLLGPAAAGEALAGMVRGGHEAAGVVGVGGLLSAALPLGGAAAVGVLAGVAVGGGASTPCFLSRVSSCAACGARV